MNTLSDLIEIDGVTMHRACAMLRVAPFALPRPALFLDRDGVLIVEKNYLGDPDGVELIPGAADAIGVAHELGYAVVVVTNQAGVGRGYYSYDDYLRVEERIAHDLGLAGVAVDAVFACPYHPDGKGEFRRAHPWRKPEPGMVTAAAKALNLDLPRSLLVGDRLSDLEAAARAGVRQGALVETGYGREETALLPGKHLTGMQVRVLTSIAAVPGLLRDLVAYSVE